MYKKLRKIHLLLGVSLVPFILLYAISALQMAHEYPIRPAITNEDLKLERGLDARPLAKELMDQHACSGDLADVKTQSARLTLTISRPGTNCTASYDRLTGHAQLERRRLSFLGLLNRLHHLNGFAHTSLAMNTWAAVLAIVSVALLGLGATGIYMWFRLHTERLTGSILLALNLCVSLLLLFLLRT